MDVSVIVGGGRREIWIRTDDQWLTASMSPCWQIALLFTLHSWTFFFSFSAFLLFMWPLHVVWSYYGNLWPSTVVWWDLVARCWSLPSLFVQPYDISPTLHPHLLEQHCKCLGSVWPMCMTVLILILCKRTLSGLILISCNQLWVLFTFQSNVLLL